jgi:hypothetical protein
MIFQSILKWLGLAQLFLRIETYLIWVIVSMAGQAGKAFQF